MLETVRIALGRRLGSGTLYECRDCGTSVQRGQNACPVCGSTEVARYDL